MSRMKTLLGGGLLGVIVIGLGLAWWLGLFASEPEEASVEASLDAIAAESDEIQNTASVEDISGTWSIELGDATFVGYRINEVLSGVGDFTAVGRTPAVTGSLVADGTTISSVEINADLTALASDNGARDNQLKTQSLETDTFPDGTFVLTEPIDIGLVPAEGETITTTATGDLSVHGVTKSVEITIDGAVQGDKLVIVGSLPILLTDFDVEPPQAPIVASVEDNAVIEFSIILVR